MHDVQDNLIPLCRMYMHALPIKPPHSCCICYFDDHFHIRVSIVSDSPEATQSEEKTTEPEYYDDIYFDSSGSEDERDESEGIRKVGKKIRKMTDDELFYDPKMDEEDEKWMKRQRMTYLNGRLIWYR